MGFKHKNGLRYFQFDIFSEQPFFHAVLTRNGGFSQPPFDSLNTGGTVGDDPQAVFKNHQLIYQTFGYDFFSRLDVWQVHGNQVMCRDQPRDPEMPHKKADGILTDNSTLTLFMRFADCVPILLWDPEKHVIGLVHAGWQGTYKMIAHHAVERMVGHYGSRPEVILAGIGPSICQNCYEVGSEVYDVFKSSFNNHQQDYFNKINDRFHLDLWFANQDILMKAGVRQIEIAGLCTACHLEDWYSHRAEAGKTGRFAVLMAIEDN